MAFHSVKSFALDDHQVAIALTHSPLGGGHLGIIFNDNGGVPRLLHLAWHHKLKVDTLPLNNCWILTPLDIPPLASKQVTAKVRAISRKLPKINYGINFIAAKGSFKETTYSPPKGSNGLTCASFVVEVLRSSAIVLIDDSSWKANAKNITWAETVCQSLMENPGDAEHVAAVRKDINGLRLIPFEVAAAGNLPKENRPVDFDTVQPLAAEAQKELSVSCPVASALPGLGG